MLVVEGWSANRYRPLAPVVCTVPMDAAVVASIKRSLMTDERVYAYNVFGYP
jgi:hypothetical protein